MLDNVIALVAFGGLIWLVGLLLVGLGKFVAAFAQALVPLSVLAIFLAILYQLLAQHLR